MRNDKQKYGIKGIKLNTVLWYLIYCRINVYRGVPEKNIIQSHLWFDDVLTGPCEISLFKKGINPRTHFTLNVLFICTNFCFNQLQIFKFRNGTLSNCVSSIHQYYLTLQSYIGLSKLNFIFIILIESCGDFFSSFSQLLFTFGVLA